MQVNTFVKKIKEKKCKKPVTNWNKNRNKRKKVLKKGQIHHKIQVKSLFL